MEKKIEEHFNEKNLRVIIVLILFLLVIPSLLNLSKGTEGGFWGSYLGGILSGIGTLFAVYITTIETRKIQKETRDNLENEKILRLQYQRRSFANEIEKLVAEYITDSTQYFSSNRYHPAIKADLTSIKVEIEKKDKEISQARESVESAKNERDILLFKYQEKKDEESLWIHKRVIAIQNLNLLKIKLHKMEEAVQLLEQLNRVHYISTQQTERFEDFTKETDELIKKLSLFSELYIG